MSISVSGQNALWAQISAYQPPSTVRSSQNGGWNSPGQAIPSASSSGLSDEILPIGGTSAGLSDGTSFALMAYRGWSNGSAASTQTAGQDPATQDASSSTDASSLTGASTGQAGITQDGTASVARLFTDLQSLLSSLTGTPTASTTGTGTETSATSDAAENSDTSTNTGTATATGLSNTVLQDLQTVSSDLASIASASGSNQTGGVGGPQPGSPPWLNAISNGGTISNTGSISNTGTATGNIGDWTPGNASRYQQQFALSAYSSSSISGLDSSATSSLAAINV